MRNRKIPETSPGQSGGMNALKLTTWGGLELPLIEQLRDEAANFRVHAVRVGEQDPAIRSNRPQLTAEKVLEHRRADVAGVLGLRHLWELQRIPEQDHGPG